MNTADNLTHLAGQLALLAEHWPMFSEEELRERPGPGRWSRKEILGHLIDSAANNYRRFVLAQVTTPPFKLLPYDQDDWVRIAAYQTAPTADMVPLWTSYNRLIMHLLAQVPDATLANECLTLNGNPTTLNWLVDDYVLHLEHHVRQIINE